MKRNIFLIFVLIVSSLLLAIPFANFVVYKLVFNYYGSWVVTKDVANFANGFPFVYILLSSLLFGIWGLGKKWIWSIISVLPILYGLFYIESSIEIWFWSIVFFASGIILAWLIRKIYFKLKHPKPPMV